MTGFKTYSEFIAETSAVEREFLAAAISEWHNEQGDALGGL